VRQLQAFPSVCCNRPLTLLLWLGLTHDVACVSVGAWQAVEDDAPPPPLPGRACIWKLSQRVARLLAVDHVRVDIFFHRGAPDGCMVNEISLSSGRWASQPARQPASRVGALAVVITQQPARDNSITRVGACSYFGTHGNLAARLWAEGWQHVRQQQVSWGVGLGAAARRHDH
jgi:hypothetical protein